MHSVIIGFTTLHLAADEPTLPRESHVRLTSRQQPRLLRNLLQLPEHHPIPFRKPTAQVFDFRLCAESLDQRLQAAEIVPRHARKQMMHRLELQATVYEVQPCGAFNVHRSPQLLLRKRLRRAEIRRACAPVR